MTLPSSVDPVKVGDRITASGVTTTAGAAVGAVTVTVTAVNAESAPAVVVRAPAAGRQIWATFSEPASEGATGPGAANPANYRINGVVLGSDATVAYDATSRTATITLPSSSAGISMSNTVAVAGVATLDGSRFPDTQVEVGLGSLAYPRAAIVGATGGRVIKVAFAPEPTSGNTGGGATNPANYRIGDAALPAGTTLALDADSEVVTITLPESATLLNGDTLKLSGVTTPSGDAFPIVSSVLGAATTTSQFVSVVAPASGRVAVVEFRPAPVAGSGTGGAANPAHYKINGAALPAGTAVSSVGEVVVLTLPADAPAVTVATKVTVDGVGVAAGGTFPQVTADAVASVSDDAQGPTAAIRAVAGGRAVTVEFSRTMLTGTSGSGVENPFNYELNGSAFPSGTSHAYNATTRIYSITLPSTAEPLKVGDRISVGGINAANGIRGEETETRVATSLAAPTATLAPSGTRAFTVQFSTAVTTGSATGSAESLLNYKLNEGAVPSGSTVSYSATTRKATVTLAETAASLQVGDRIGVAGVTTQAGGQIPATIATLVAAGAGSTTTTLAPTTTICVDPTVAAAEVDNSGNLPRTGSPTRIYVVIGGLALLGGEVFRRRMLKA